MHGMNVCKYCKYLEMYEPHRMKYKCKYHNTIFNSEELYDVSCFHFEERNKENMLKHFCDICKKELAPDEETFCFTIESSGDDPTYDTCHEEVCKDCRKQIEDYIDYLAYVKYKEGETK